MIEQSSLHNQELLRYEELVDEDNTETVCITLRSVWIGGDDQRFAISVLTGDREYDILVGEMTNYFFEIEDADEEFDRVVSNFKRNEFGKGVIN